MGFSKFNRALWRYAIAGQESRDGRVWPAQKIRKEEDSSTFWMMLKLSSAVISLSLEAYYLERTKGGGGVGKLEHVAPSSVAARWVAASELWRKVHCNIQIALRD